MVVRSAFVVMLALARAAHAQLPPPPPLLDGLEDRVMQGRVQRPVVERLEAAVAQKPDDPQLRLSLARELRRLQRMPEAAAQYRKLVDQEDRAIAAEAAAALEELELEDQRQQRLADTARAFVERFAGTPAAAQHLALLG